MVCFISGEHDFATDGHVGSEIYVGCSNGELLRFTLQADDPNKVCPLV